MSADYWIGPADSGTRIFVNCLMLLALLLFLEACSKPRTLMTDAELDQQKAGTVEFRLCDGACGVSIAQIIDGDAFHNTCPPDCSIIAAQASPGETVTLRQELRSHGSVVIQQNSWTAGPAVRPMTVLPLANPHLP
jgi:hypothetical protein